MDSGSTATCNNSQRLYCIEQPDPGCAPNSFSFTPAVNAVRSSLITSNAVTPIGCGTSSLALVYGEGSPQLSINGGAWANSGTLNPGDTIAIRLTSKSGYNQITTARLSLGTMESSWTVTAVSSGASSRIFATAGVYNGNLGGLVGADAICQTEATGLGYSGTWKALLSTNALNARDRLTLVYPVVRASDGEVVAATNLWSGTLAAAPVTSNFNTAWTGTASAGDKYGTNFCDNWTNGTIGYGSEIGGYTQNTNGSWIANGFGTCNITNNLYCVSQ